MIRFIFVVALFSAADAFCGPMNHQATLAQTLFEKLRSQPNISFKDFIQFANEQEPVSIRVNFDSKQYTSDVHEKTACGTIEALLPVTAFNGKSFKVKSEKGTDSFSTEGAYPATVTWNSKTYLIVGPHPPYRVDSQKGRLLFIFGFPEGVKLPVSSKWWQEIVARVPTLNPESGPFLLVESTPSGVRFTTDFEDYKRSAIQEARPTHDELVRQPFSKIFHYSEENLRLQVPQPCN